MCVCVLLAVLLGWLVGGGGSVRSCVYRGSTVWGYSVTMKWLGPAAGGGRVEREKDRKRPTKDDAKYRHTYTEG